MRDAFVLFSVLNKRTKKVVPTTGVEPTQAFRPYEFSYRLRLSPRHLARSR